MDRSRQEGQLSEADKPAAPLCDTGRHAYIDGLDFSTEGLAMPLHIADPAVVGKVERLGRVTGVSKTAAVERAVDQLLRELDGAADPAACMRALLAQLDRIPDRADAFDPLPWDEAGLPE
jgi:antitoxin VapB